MYKFKLIAILCSLSLLFLFSCKVTDAGAPSEGSTDTKTWTVTIDLKGGTGPTTNYTVDDGKAAPLTIPKKPGFEFLGWTTNSAALTADYNASAAITANTNLYAVWKLLPLDQRVILTKDYATFHTFQMQVEILAIDADTTLEFIVTHEPTAPAYSLIQSDGAKRSAFFSTTAPKRGVNFIFKSGGTYDGNHYPVLATQSGIYEPTNNKKYIDLKAKTSQADVQTAIESVNPALLSPGGTYYVHIYKDNALLKTSDVIILPDYFTTTWPTPITRVAYDLTPTTAIDINKFLVGRDGYKTFAQLVTANNEVVPSQNTSNNSAIEVNDGDVAFYPFTFVFPVEYPKASCSTTGTGSSSPSLKFFFNQAGSSSTNITFDLYPMQTTLGNYPLISFAVPSLPTNYGTKFTHEGTSSTNTDQYFVYDVILPIKMNTVIDNNIIYSAFSCQGLSTVVDAVLINSVYRTKVYTK